MSTYGIPVTKSRFFVILVIAILGGLLFFGLYLNRPQPQLIAGRGPGDRIGVLDWDPETASTTTTGADNLLAPALPGAADAEEGGEGGGPFRRRDWFWQQRAYPLDTLPVDANVKGIRQLQQMVSVQSAAQTWNALGPAPIIDGLVGVGSCTWDSCQTWRTPVSGRTKAIAFHPTNPQIMYVGTATGGLWKTSDGGASYIPLTDSQESFSIFSLAIDPNNPNIIYAGTGEISGYYGVGLLKSTDAGATWSLLAQSEFAGLVVTSILIHPNDSNTLYAATAHPLQFVGKNLPLPGIFRSTNGGQSWQPLLQCQDICYGFTDLVMEENSNPLVLYAAVGATGVFKSMDGGNTWGALNFPDRGYTRVELAIGRGAGAGTLYAGLAGALQIDGKLVPWGILMKSSDHGQTWGFLQQAPNYCSSQCGYDNIITVDPRNADVVYIGGSMIAGEAGWGGVVHKSVDGGFSWQDLTPGTSLDSMVHPDMHAIVLNPSNPDIVWVGNDGGLFLSTNGGQNWSSRNGNLSTTQFVNIGIHPSDPNIAFGGLQDNAKAKYNGSFWEGLDTGDGGFSEIDPFNPSIWYSTRYSVSGRIIQFQRNINGGTAALEDWEQTAQGIDVNDRVQFYVPFELDRVTPGVIYLGTHRLYRTTSRGDSWSVISGDLTKGADTNGSITAIAVAPSDPNSIYVGTSDGNIQMTNNAGASWNNLTKAPLPNRHVSDIAVHPTIPTTAYAVMNGYNTHTPGAPGHVFVTTNAGQSWQDVSGDLPDIPALTIVIDPEQPSHLYIGTDLGVFHSNAGGQIWSAYNTGMPYVPVTDLELNQPNRMLWAGTYGRGVYRLSLGGTAPLTERIRLPFLSINYAAPIITPSPQPSVTPANTATATPTLPPSGPSPGLWEGERARFIVSSDQENAWDVLIKVPVPGCETWVSYLDAAAIDAGGTFSFEVDLRENGIWRNSGSFNTSISAQGTAEFDNVYFGLSCGTWTGNVDWMATWKESAPDPTPAPTATPAGPTPTPSSTSGIYGQVRDQGVGVVGITVLLRQCPTTGPCDFEASKLMTTVTDNAGYYNFTGVPTLPTDQYYFVFYYNHTDGGNLADDHYLWRWYTPAITAYTAGASLHGGSFDISEIRLMSPTSGTVDLPATFEWSSRNLPGEYYAWELFDLNTGSSLCSSSPATSVSFTLSADDFTSVCGGSYGTEYGWFVWALDGPDWDSGIGDSYYYASISFSATSLPTATPTPIPTLTPTVAPSTGIYGQVRDQGAPADGVTIILRSCISGSCTNFRTATTDSGGNYSFTNVPALGSGEIYNVAYINGASGGNPLDASRLAWWVSYEITSYTAGSNVLGGNFDIVDVALSAPAHNASVTIPATFSWVGRGVANDRYSWSLGTTGGSLLCYVDPPANATSFVLDETTGAQCGLFFNTPYNWYLYVADGTWSNGYGLSYYYRTVTFLQSAALKENRFLGDAPPPAVLSEPKTRERGLPAPRAANLP